MGSAFVNALKVHQEHSAWFHNLRKPPDAEFDQYRKKSKRPIPVVVLTPR
jgi:hypothetical protein